MKTSEAWVELALKTLSCNQKDLARRAGVSPAQISKWKNGEHMSSEMEDMFRGMVRIGENQHPEFVLWAGSLQDAVKWDKLIQFLAEDARDSAETGYRTYPLEDDLGMLSLFVSYTLTEMGIEPPKSFPPELEPYFEDSGEVIKEAEPEDEEVGFGPGEALYDSLDASPYSKVIRDIFDSLNDVYGFYAAYVCEVIDKLINDDDADSSLFDLQGNIESCLIDLAASKIAVDESFASKIRAFRRRITREYEEWLTTLKDAAFRAGIPLRAELLDMVSKDAGELGHTAEAESLGFNAHRLHPDIYMNELLVGMRTIHQVLPAILKKLDIDFKLDSSELRLNTRARYGASFTAEEPPDEED